MTCREIFQQVYFRIAPEVNELYEHFKAYRELPHEENTEHQLEILVEKKYISITYISDLGMIVGYYQSEMLMEYEKALRDYKSRIRFFLDS